MENFLRRFLVACLVSLVLPSYLPAAAYLFVFHDGTAANAHDALTLELLASPEVGAGAVQAIGVPDPARVNRLLKIYVVTRSTVVVLDPEPPFTPRATLVLSGDITSGEKSAVLTPDGSKLLVLAGQSLHVFNTLDAANPAATVIGLGSTPAQMAVLSNSSRAFVSIPGAATLRTVSLTTTPPQLLAGSVTLPEPADAIGAAPNGSALYAAAPGVVFEIDPFLSTVRSTISSGVGIPLEVGFNPDAPLNQIFVNQGGALRFISLTGGTSVVVFIPLGGLTKALTPGEDAAYFLSSATGRIYRGLIDGGSSTLLRNPDTGLAFPSTAVDAEIDPANQNLFVAFDRELARLDAAANHLFAQVNSPVEPRGIAVVETPGLLPSRIAIYGGDDQIAPVGELLAQPLAVRVIASDFRPPFRQSVKFTADAPGVQFDPATALTNLNGVAETRLRVPTNEIFQVEAEVIPEAYKVTFDVNTGIPGQQGLSVISGDYQITLGGTNFPRPHVIRASGGGGPIVDLDLTITPSSDVINCPAMATTDANGEAAFICSADAVILRGEFEIEIEDETGRTLPEPIQLQVVPTEGLLPRPQRVVRPRFPQTLSAIVGQSIPDAIEFRITDRANDFGVANIGIELESEGSGIPDPMTISNDTGAAIVGVTFGCEIGEGEILATLNAPGVNPPGPPEVTIPYTVSPGPPAAIRRTRGDNQAGSPGQQLPLALAVEVSDGCEHLSADVPISWEVTPPGAATLRGAFARTNAAGQASTLVVLGNTPGRFTVTVNVGDVATVFNLSVEDEPALLLQVEGDGQSVIVGQPAADPLTVEVQDDAGNPLVGIEVQFRVTTGAATLSANRVITNEEGLASTEVVAGTVLQTVSVEARVGQLVTLFRLTIVGRTPVVTSTDLVNGASFVRGWVPGGLGSIFGTGLMEGVDGIVLAETAPFPTTLRGVQVLVENIPAPIISIANVNGQEQINIQVPFQIAAPSNNAVVTIINNGASTTVVGVQILREQPGIFEYTIPEGEFAAALHADFSPVRPSNPARPGEVILLFWTGGGRLTLAVGTNVAGPVPPARTVETPTVLVDGAEAEMLGSFYAPTLYTAYQINLRIPANASSGNLTIQINVNGVTSQEAVIPVEQ